jgi:hypothetical protein
MHIKVPTFIGSSKGIQENHFLKIEMTKSNAFLVTTLESILISSVRVQLLSCRSLRLLFVKKGKDFEEIPIFQKI